MSLVTTGIEDGNRGLAPRPALTLERNPVADRAAVSYELSHGGSVSCVVYDAAGQQVARLLEGVQPAGRHVVEWNSANAAPGLYFIEMATGGSSSTVRVVKAR